MTIQSELAGRPKRSALPILTSLRFFAALEVVVFHISIGSSSAAIPEGVFRNLASGGYAAVSFFFVLSGFVLTYAHAGPIEREGCNVEARRFWLLRFARLAPAYYLGLLLAAPIVIAYVASHAPAPTAFIAPLLVVVFLQAWWSPLALTWNFPAWSLSVECLFYALFPWLARVSARWPRTVLFVACYVLVVAATAYRADFLSLPGKFPEDRMDLYFQAYFPLPYLPLFVFGMALGRQYLFGRRLAPLTHAAMLWAGVVLTVLAFAGKSVLPWVDSFGCRPLSCLRTDDLRWRRSDRRRAVAGLRRDGAAGRSQLRHVHPARPHTLLVGAVAGGRRRGSPPRLYVALHITTVVVVSILVFRYVETPLRRWIARPPAAAPGN